MPSPCPAHSLPQAPRTAAPRACHALQARGREDLDGGVELAATSLIDCYGGWLGPGLAGLAWPGLAWPGLAWPSLAPGVGGSARQVGAQHAVSMSLDKWAHLYTADPYP